MDKHYQQLSKITKTIDSLISENNEKMSEYKREMFELCELLDFLDNLKKPKSGNSEELVDYGNAIISAIKKYKEVTTHN